MMPKHCRSFSNSTYPQTMRASHHPQRTYRACDPCRSVGLCAPTVVNLQRKLKCHFGDPNAPWDGPCQRCMREQRECLRPPANAVRKAIPRKADTTEERWSQVAKRPRVLPTAASTTEPGTGLATLSPPSHRRLGADEYVGTVDRATAGSFMQVVGSLPTQPRGHAPPSSGSGDDDDDDDDDEVANRETTESALVRSHLQNPNDALRLLVSASSLRFPARCDTQSHLPNGTSGSMTNTAIWETWEPLQEGLLTLSEAHALLTL